MLVFVPDINQQADDGDDQTTESSDFVGSQSEIDGSAATAILGGCCCFGDLQAHGLLRRLIRRQRHVSFSQPREVLLVVGVGGVEGDEGVVCEALNAVEICKFVHL